MTPSFRYVVFDAAGTLIYPDPPAAEVYWRVGRACGSKLERHEVASRFQQAASRHACPAGTRTCEADEYARWRSIVADTLDDARDPAAAFEQLWDHFAAPRNWRVYDDVAEAWRFLERRSIRVAIASNFDARLQNIVEYLAPIRTAGHLFYSSRVGYAKPSAQFFQAIEQQLAAPPHELLMIGDDRRNDVLPPRARGWHAWHLARGQAATDDQTLPSLAEIGRSFPSCRG